MNDIPDPNLDDDDLIQSMFENQQAILAGYSCDMCNAEWINHRMIHTPDCLFVIVGDMLADRSAIEEAWGGDAA